MTYYLYAESLRIKMTISKSLSNFENSNSNFFKQVENSRNFNLLIKKECNLRSEDRGHVKCYVRLGPRFFGTTVPFYRNRCVMSGVRIEAYIVFKFESQRGVQTCLISSP